MKVTLLQIDKTTENYLIEGISIYLKRLKNYTAFEIATINVPKAVRMRPEAEQKSEGEVELGGALVARLDPRTRAHPGERLVLGVDIERAHFFDPSTGNAI